MQEVSDEGFPFPECGLDISVREFLVPRPEREFGCGGKLGLDAADIGADGDEIRWPAVQEMMAGQTEAGNLGSSHDGGVRSCMVWGLRVPPGTWHIYLRLTQP
ncbi:MAG: hypothetical protein DMG69_20005 [Acidobacteria bacterium]|nr:MAG: hypothetical protein DMG69_20005 [Acidobacteriota bacterium]